MVVRQFARVTFLSDNRNDLSRLDLPCLILQASDDVIAPVQVGKFTADNVANSTLHRLDAVGHCPHVSAPRATIAALKDFLRTLAKS